MGNAVNDACEHLRDEILKAAARLHGGQPDEWQLIEGVLERGTTRVSVADLRQLAKAARQKPYEVALRNRLRQKLSS